MNHHKSTRENGIRRFSAHNFRLSELLLALAFYSTYDEKDNFNGLKVKALPRALFLHSKEPLIFHRMRFISARHHQTYPEFKSLHLTKKLSLAKVQNYAPHVIESLQHLNFVHDTFYKDLESGKLAMSKADYLLQLYGLRAYTQLFLLEIAGNWVENLVRNTLGYTSDVLTVRIADYANSISYASEEEIAYNIRKETKRLAQLRSDFNYIANRAKYLHGSPGLPYHLENSTVLRMDFSLL